MENERLAQLLQKAQAEYSAKAMWWLRGELEPRTQWPVVVKALRTHGGHGGMILAEQIEEAGNAADRVSA